MEEQWTNILRKGKMTQALRSHALETLNKFNNHLQRQENVILQRLSNADSDLKRKFYEKLYDLSQPSKTFYKWIQTNLEDYDKGEIEGGFKDYWNRYMQLLGKVKTEIDLARGD